VAPLGDRRYAAVPSFDTAIGSVEKQVVIGGKAHPAARAFAKGFTLSIDGESGGIAISMVFL